MVHALVYSHKDRIKWFHSTPDFPFKLIEPGSQVRPESGAHEFFSGRMRAPETEEVSVDCWLEDGRVDTEWTIREITIPMPSYKSVLSVLWIVPCSKLDFYAAEEG